MAAKLLCKVLEETYYNLLIQVHIRIFIYLSFFIGRNNVATAENNVYTRKTMKTSSLFSKKNQNYTISQFWKDCKF